MKIGVLGDVHNNVQAFEAILERFRKEETELILCTGDLVGIGPSPEEVVSLAMSVPNFRCVKGNHENALFKTPEGLSEPELAHLKWKLGKLSKASLSYLSGLPMEYEMNCEGLKIKLLHYPFDGNKFRKVNENPESDEFRQLFSDVRGDIVLFGHGHHRAVSVKDGRYLLNFGSCGCPHEDRGIARGGIVEIKNGSVSFKDVCAEYDLSAVISEIDKLKYADFAYIKRVFYGQNI